MKFEKKISGSFDSAILTVTEALKKVQFGILTRIDFDQKIKEKLGKELPRTTILGACNPALAYEAYLNDPNMLLLIPCNVVVEQKTDGVNVSVIKPSEMLKQLNAPHLKAMAEKADHILQEAIQSMECE